MSFVYSFVVLYWPLQGSSQWILVKFTQQYPVSGFTIQFAGGFSAKTICLQTTTTTGSSPETLYTFYPEDTNKEQTFSLTSNGEPALITDNLRFHFPGSTDTFGRIIVYKLNIFKQS
jgi:hypothetical protein